jgi:hypothetical protein
MPENDKSDERGISSSERDKQLVAEDSGTSGTQEAGAPIEPEVLKPDASGLWGDDLVEVLKEDRRSLGAVARHLLVFAIREVRKKDREIDGLRLELKETSKALTTEQIAHARTQERLNSANVTPALVFGPLVAALGIAVYQNGLRVYGGLLVGVGTLWMASGVWTWWGRK